MMMKMQMIIKNDADEDDEDADDDFFAETCKKEVNAGLHPGVLCAGNLKKGGVDSCQVMMMIMMKMTMMITVTMTLMITVTIMMRMMTVLMTVMMK